MIKKLLILLAIILIPNTAFANEPVEIKEEIVDYDNTSLDDILYDFYDNKMEKPEISDFIMKTPETAAKYAKSFAVRYERLKESNDSSIYVKDIVEDMLDDSNVTFTREMVEKKPHFEEEMIRNVHRYLPIYKDDVEFEGTNNVLSKYDKKTGRYYIAQNQEARDEGVEIYNEGKDNEYRSYRAMNEEQKRQTELKADDVVRDTIKSHMSEAQKARALAKYLAENVSYDYDKEKNPTTVENTAYGALVLGKTRCLGVSRAYTMLLRRAGIPAITIHGSLVNGGNHAWNVVKVDEGWRVVDTTSAIEDHKINEKYFLKRGSEIPLFENVERSIYSSLMNLTEQD